MMNITGFTSPISSVNNEMLVVLESTGPFSAKGFKANYATVNFQIKNIFYIIKLFDVKFSL